ncbi:MAG TPA: MBL fold metallo-hydrolase [Anaerolineae bacterium]|nr:MBL fold metallo-hydrolase [Anaerolineae bacterium]
MDALLQLTFHDHPLRIRVTPLWTMARLLAHLTPPLSNSLHCTTVKSDEKSVRAHHTQPFTTAGLLIEREGVRILYAPDFHHANLAADLAADLALVRPLDLAILDGSFLTREQMDARYTPSVEEGQGRHTPIVEEVHWAESAGARQVLFTHVGHLQCTPEEALALVPHGAAAFAHDGLVLEL